MKTALMGSITIGLVALAAPALADDAVKGATPQTSAQPNQQTSVTTTTAATAPPGAGDSPLAPTPQAVPPERDTVTLYQNNRPNKAYLYTGGAIFLGTYATTAALNAANDVDRSLYIPVAGPWLHLADRQDGSAFDTVLIAGSGVLQGVGVLLTTASFFIPEKVPAATIQAGNVKLNVTPTAYGRGSAGIGAVGTF